MDESLLISGESSGSSKSIVSRRRKEFYSSIRRSDAITYGSPYQKAAALVDLAEDGLGLPEQLLNQSHFQSSAKLYFMFTKFDLIWSLNYFALIVLNFLEKPLWCSRTTEYTCSDREYYYLGQLPYLTGTEALIYEGITLFVLMVHTLFPIAYEGSRIYWNNSLTRLKVIFLLILVTDFVVYTIYLSPVTFGFLPLGLRHILELSFSSSTLGTGITGSILILAGMLQTYLNVLALGLLFLLFSSWLAYVIFEDTAAGKVVFSSYGTTLYQMFVLFTTSNNPDVWIPAYKASRWYSLFFILYILLAVYFVTNLILAVVYDSFKSQLVKQVSEMDCTRTRILEKAFKLIDKYNAGYLNKEQCVQLFEELNRYRTLPKTTKEEFELIFDELDDSGDFKINLEEFADLCNAIALKFQKEDTLSWFEKFPFYHSPFSRKLKAFIRSPKFGYIISFILVLNLITVIVETTLDIQNSSGQKVWQAVEFVLVDICTETALKVYAYGFENYWRDGQNRFDFVITWTIVIGETLTIASPNGLSFLSNGEWIRYLLLARLLRLIRLLMHVQSYRAFVATFLTLIPSLMPYLGIIFCVLCIYCSLGVQIFGGIVNAGNLKLQQTDLADNDYLLFNFNDYPNGMVTLFNLLIMDNSPEWMQSYKELTGSSWSLAYFISFFLITVLLLLNLIVAFVLEAFFAEMELEDSEKCPNNKDGSGKYRHRYAGTKTHSQRVDALLHHMLSAELKQTQSSDA